MIFRIGVLLTAMCFLTACNFLTEERATKSIGGAYYQDDGPPIAKEVSLDQVKDAIPRAEPLSRLGNAPYTVFGKRYYPLKSATGYKEIGEASWYGKKFHGRKTSSGEVYDMYKMTAAHTTLPLPSYVRVRRLDTDNVVVVRVNDRGPFLKGRIIDLSYVAAKKLGLVSLGTAEVEVVSVDILHQKSPAKRLGRFLEVGRFRLPENAEHLHRRLLKDKLSSVEIIANETDGIIYYHVQVGPIGSSESIDQYMYQIEKTTGILPRIVSD